MKSVCVALAYVEEDHTGDGCSSITSFTACNYCGCFIYQHVLCNYGLGSARLIYSIGSQEKIARERG